MKLIKDIVHDSIELSPLEAAIISKSSFNRLHHIKQLGQVQFVYPSATHTRYSHSIGTMHLAGLAYQYSLLNSSDEIIIAYAKSAYERLREVQLRVIDRSSEEYRNIWVPLLNASRKQGNIVAPPDDPFDRRSDTEAARQLEESLSFIDSFVSNIPIIVPANNILFSNAIHYNVLKFELSLVRLLGLLHDIGHLPMSHLLEEAVVEYLSRTSIAKKRNNLSSTGSSSALHELLSSTLILSLFKEVAADLLPSDTNTRIHKLRLLLFYAAIIPKILSNQSHKHLYQIISNAIDVDKLDYIVRDGILTGTGNSSSEALRVLKTMKMCKVPNNDNNIISFTFAISAKAIKNTENILKDRASLYKTVIGHHKSRKYEMLYKIILSNILLNLRRIKKGGDEDCNALLDNPLFDFIEELENNKYDLIPGYMSVLTDEWLESWLRDTYHKLQREDELFMKCIPHFLEDKTDIMKFLTELFNGVKSHAALWKRDYVFTRYIHGEHIRTINNKINYLYKRLPGNYDIEDEVYSDSIALGYKLSSIISSLSYWADTFYSRDNSSPNDSGGHAKNSFYSYLISYLHNQFINPPNKILNKQLGRYDLLIYPNNIKVGHADLFIHTDFGYSNIDEVSPINHLLVIEKANTVPIYLYVKNEYHQLFASNIESVFENTIYALISAIYEIYKSKA